jgi:hypothetical protein
MADKYQMGASLLTPIWRGVPADYKRKYAMTIWRQFEDNIRSAAYTSSLSKFVNTICSRLQVKIAADDVEAVEHTVSSGNDRELLRLLRDEATMLVLMVRIANDRRRDEWEAKRAADEAALTAWTAE